MYIFPRTFGHYNHIFSSFFAKDFHGYFCYLFPSSIMNPIVGHTKIFYFIFLSFFFLFINFLYFYPSCFPLAQLFFFSPKPWQAFPLWGGGGKM